MVLNVMCYFFLRHGVDKSVNKYRCVNEQLEPINQIILISDIHENNASHDSRL